MKKTVLIGWLALWAATALAATPLPDAELHRLASYLAYITTTLDPDDPGGIEYTVGDTCQNCQGSGILGDGRVEFPCEWEDGKYYCSSGKIAMRSDGDAMDVCEIGCALCEETPECEQLDDPPARFNADYVRQLECDLQKALEEVENSKATCPDCPTCADPQQTEDQPETPEPAPACLTDLSQTQWNWQGTSNVPISEMRRHLTDEHSIDPASLDKMNREELIALHNLLHNEEVRASTPQAKSKTKTYSSGGCPGGSCPSGSSRSYSRGLFGRWR